VLHLVDFGPALIIGLVYILRRDVNLSNLRALTSSQTVEHAIEDEPILPDEDYGEGQLKAVAARD
jgi:hypothetical protein